MEFALPQETATPVAQETDSEWKVLLRVFLWAWFEPLSDSCGHLTGFRV